MEDSKRVVKQLRLMIDNRDEESFPLIEDWIAKVKEALADLGHITVTGENYLILDREAGTGQVCRVEDYDPETRGFLPGKTPPPWAGGAPGKGPHKLAQDGTKYPVQPAPSYFGASSATKTVARPAPAPKPVEDDEEELDLEELDFKAVENDAEETAASVAADAAKKFKLKKK